MTAWWFEHLWPGAGEVRAGMVVDVDNGLITRVESDAAGVPAGSERVLGLTVPGLANTHSHAFHRALRSRTQQGSGDFWAWRERMYDVAARLEPDSYFALARGVFAEMACAGITAVGEFHYLHHRLDGRSYDDANAMAMALVGAAAEAGLRLTLLDTCYLESAPGRPVERGQLRFADASASAWAERAGELARRCSGTPHVRVGAAVHSVRAVPPAAISAVVDWASARAAPLHAHLSEQVAENAACLAAYGRTPAQLLFDRGALGPRTTVVHATHLDAADIQLLGSTGTGVCYCPTTERDLADGLPLAREQANAGAPISLGSDSNAVIDLFEEARGLEGNERLRTQLRGHFGAAELMTAATATGQRALGWDGGRIEVGARADFVTVRLDSVRTAGGGATLDAVAFAASAADVDQVVVDGRTVVRAGHHVGVPDVAQALRIEIERLLA